MKTYWLLTISLVLFFIIVIVLHAVYVKKKNKSGSFMTVEIIFVMLILLGMSIVNKTALDYGGLLDSTESYSHQSSTNNGNNQDNQSNESNLVSNLISMQANTLSVTVTIVTISCIIISILTIYRERKTEVNSQKLETSLKKLKKTEAVIQDIAAISSVLLLTDNKRDYFISIIKNEAEKLSVNREEPVDIATAHYRMIMLNMILDEQYYTPKNQDDMKKFDIIIECANEIIENEDASRLSVYFAIIERAHAAFQKLKTSTDTESLDIKQIRDNIKSANNYAQYLDKIDDDGGNTQNLMGLTELWIGIAKFRINDTVKNMAMFSSSDCLRHFRKALKYFEQAQIKNESKKEFINHRIVALLRISDVCDDSNKLKNIEDAIKLCTPFADSEYNKPLVNLADAYIRQLRFFLRPEQKWNVDIKRHIYDYSKLDPQETSGVQKIYDDAIKALDKAVEIDHNFANSHYKWAEVNFLWLGYNIWLKSNHKDSISLEDMRIIYNGCMEKLSTASGIIGETAKIKGYRVSLNLLDEKLKEIDNTNVQKNNCKKRGARKR